MGDIFSISLRASRKITLNYATNCAIHCLIPISARPFQNLPSHFSPMNVKDWIRPRSANTPADMMRAHPLLGGEDTGEGEQKLTSASHTLRIHDLLPKVGSFIAVSTAGFSVYGERAEWTKVQIS
jgi:hypothetical protein